MRTTHLSILIFAAFVIAWPAMAQEPVPAALSPLFPNIRASIDDGFYTLAEQQARGVLRAEPKEDEAREASLLLAHALWGQKRYSEMLATLQAYNGDPGFVYWRARAHYELKQRKQALALLATPDEAMRKSRFAPAAMRLKGRLERELGQLMDAEKTYLAFAKAFPNNRAYVENQFDLAATQAELGRVPEALAVYEDIAGGDQRRAADRAKLARARLLSERGAEENWPLARAELTGLATNDQTRLAYRIDAYIELAALEDQAGDAAASGAALRAGIALSPDARQRVPLKMELARLLIREEEVPAALKLLEECRAEAPNEQIAAELQLAKANGLMKAERYAEADEAFQVYLDVADDPDGLAKAYLGKGLALWELERYAEAASVFDKAEKALKDPAVRADALFKAADSYYKAEKFEDAEKRYRAFVTDFSAHKNMSNALYQLGLTLAKIGRLPEALSTFDLLETNHSGTPFAEKAALRSADVLWASRKWEEVLAKYTAIANTYTNSPDTQALSEHWRGITLDTLGRYPDAQKAFETVIENYPESEYVPQATYMRGFCLYRQGLVKEGIETCTKFVENYPDSQWTPEVIFWIAQHYYNLGDYEAAEPLFLRVPTEFKGNELAPRALYWAGRCADARNNYVKAIERYSEIAKTYPDAEIMDATRFAQGDALTQLGEFARAILAFEEVIKNYPESYLVNAAWGRKGDCQFSLAPDNPERYAESMNSYQAILDSTSAPTALRLQAEYKIGRSLEKAGAFDKAFARYMNVVHTFIHENVERSPHSIRWFTRAAIEAGAIKERGRDWIGAVTIYEHLVKENAPSKAWAEERIEKIKNDNWLLFQRSEETAGAADAVDF